MRQHSDIVTTPTYLDYSQFHSSIWSPSLPRRRRRRPSDEILASHFSRCTGCQSGHQWVLQCSPDFLVRESDKLIISEDHHKLTDAMTKTSLKSHLSLVLRLDPTVKTDQEKSKKKEEGEKSERFSGETLQSAVPHHFLLLPPMIMSQCQSVISGNDENNIENIMYTFT